jgi:intraflagellar transport protein 172
MIDCCLKRGLIRNRFETTYVGPSQVIEIIQHILSYCKQVIIKDVNGGNRVTIRSEMGLEIDEIKVMGKDRYVVAYTSGSLLLADIESAKSSEIVWQSAGNEKFYFENENVCNTCFV